MEQGKTAACADGEREVEVARNVNADLVLTGEVLVIEGTYIVTLKLHDVHTAGLLATRNATGKGQLEVFNGVSGATRVLLRKSLGLPDGAVSGPIDEPLATDAPVPGAMLVTFTPDSRSERWTHLDHGGKPLCRLPCQRWVPPDSGYSVQLDAAKKQDITRLRVPADLGTRLGGPSKRPRSRGGPASGEGSSEASSAEPPASTVCTSCSEPMATIVRARMAAAPAVPRRASRWASPSGS
jgi:hypothetical protein